MGNSNKAAELKEGNEILIEFMTADQKVKKDRIISKTQLEVQQDEEDFDVEIINDFKKLYDVDFRKVIFTEHDLVSYDVQYVFM
jgi:hypothetical protein